MRDKFFIHQGNFYSLDVVGLTFAVVIKNMMRITGCDNYLVITYILHPNKLYLYHTKGHYGHHIVRKTTTYQEAEALANAIKKHSRLSPHVFMIEKMFEEGQANRYIEMLANKYFETVVPGLEV